MGTTDSAGKVRQFTQTLTSTEENPKDRPEETGGKLEKRLSVCQLIGILSKEKEMERTTERKRQKEESGR